MPKFIIPSIFTAVDKFSPVIKGMSGNMDAFAARAERKVRAIGTAAEKIGKSAGVMGLALAAPLIMATQSAMAFEAQMSNVATLLDTNKENMASMGKEVLSLATKLPVPIEELTQSLYDIRSSGIGADRAMQTLEISAKLSAAGLSTTSESTNILTSAMNAFAADGLTTAQTADYLFKTVKAGKTTLSQLAVGFGATAPIVQSAGASLADFQAITAALTLSGTPASQAQNQIKASMVALMKPTKELESIMSKLGVKTSQELIKKSGGVVNAFRAVTSQGKKMGINMAKAWGSTEALAAVTPLIDSASTASIAYSGALEDMLHGANAVDSAFEKQNKTSKAQLQLMKNNIEALSISVGSVLLPVINKLIGKIIPLVQGFSKWSQENPKLFKGLVIGTAVLAAFLLTVSAVAFAISFASKTMLVWGVITKTFTVAQWLLNAAMSANPIGLIIIGIAALIASIVIVVAKYNEWGAAMSFLLGPFGIIINLVQAFRRNWDAISEAFASGNILQGFRLIGATILDSILMPLEQIFSLMTNLPGVGKFAQSAVAKIGELRAGLGVNTTTDENGNQTTQAKSAPLLNTQVEKEANMKRMFETSSRSQVDLNVRAPKDTVEPVSSSPDVKVKVSSTMPTS